MPSPVAAEHIASSNPEWNAAVARAGELAALSVGVHRRVSWDFVATRGIIATAVYALAHRDGIEVADVGLDALACPLFRREDFIGLATTQLADAGHAFDHFDVDDPVSCQWEWLNRCWKNDEDAPYNELWDGLPRGIARGLRWPAIDVCLSWAGNAVDRALSAERGALERRTNVVITDGEFAGQRGFIESPAWNLDARRRVVLPGPPAGYMINLGEEHGFRAERVLVHHLTVDDNQPTT